MRRTAGKPIAKVGVGRRVRGTTAAAILGSLLISLGGSMVGSALFSYAVSVPRTVWLLYTYLPIGVLLLGWGIAVVIRAQIRYASGPPQAPDS